MFLKLDYKITFFYVALIFGINIPATAVQTADSEKDEILWYNRPADLWTEALPLGNGHLGAMVFGGIEQEHLQLNENTLYSGDPFHTYKSIDIRKKYGEVISLLNEGKFKLAENIIANEWLGRRNQCYQPMADVWIDFNHKGLVQNYKRTLELSDAVSRVEYQVGETRFTREYFISNPDRVMVIRLKAEGPEKINASIHLSSPHLEPLEVKSSGNLISLKSKAPGFVLSRELKLVEKLGDQYKYPELYTKSGTLKHEASRILYGEKAGGLGMAFELLITPIYWEGDVIVSDDKIVVQGASEVHLLLTAATGYNGYDNTPISAELAHRKAIGFLDNAKRKKYHELYNNHVHDYRTLYSTVSIRLGNKSLQSQYPTDKRLELFTNGKDPSLSSLYFQYGRYLMIAGSRNGGQPLNLQGIWNDKIIPPWNGTYTLNINLQMNYWPAEVANLSECHKPLFDAIKELAVNGSKTARMMYGNEGWVVHHNTDIWRHTEPIDNCKCAFWPMGAGWLVSHLWEHYLFNGDLDFLKKTVYPLLKGSVEFYKDWLVPTVNGFLITPVGHSPELNFQSGDNETSSFAPGPTMDIAIIRESYSRFLEAYSILLYEEDKQLAETISEQLEKLHPYLVGRYGHLQEWLQDFEDADSKHRHISHLYGIFPGNQIHMHADLRLSSAVEKVLDRRGEGGMGWSKTWKQAIWARLLNGEKAYSHLQSQLTLISENKEGIHPGGTFPNLFCGTPFQIDGNFGAVAGIAEMLVQSHAGEIHLLPALPSAWKDGKVKGLKTRGGFEVDMEWKDGKIVNAVIYSKLGGNCRIRTNNKIKFSDSVQFHLANGPNPNPLFNYIDPGSPVLNTEKDIPEFRYKNSTVCTDIVTEKGKIYRFKEL